MEVRSKDDKVQIELEGWEPHWLMSMLLHAKLCDDPRPEVWSHPVIIELIKGLSPYRPEADQPLPWILSGGVVGDKTGGQAPSSFYMMEAAIRDRVSGEEFERQFADAIFPWTLRGELKRDIFVPPGSRVALPESSKFHAESPVGIVVSCWPSEQFSNYKCYVSLDADADMLDKPDGPPQIVCFDAAELRIVG